MIQICLGVKVGQKLIDHKFADSRSPRVKNFIKIQFLVIPQVLRDFQLRLQREIPVTKEIVLNGCETDLESLLVNRRVNEHNYLRILERISQFLFNPACSGFLRKNQFLSRER